ncbi:endonuclease/exonuclease/phosphatase family protein [Xylanibacter muris]|uniref:Endonuclease/exonuclease/phosphatase family protein n=1 Tax=Xylanibacter muris TaxID=2736290 RepID=A0ABX2AM91_9BACT|nr:endonuclease/exonuclease/phosphatase family protein [Xylanibacter muris]NPD92346.1 endonuclease/exonuclease/phosphatase family protein [Xylanibacter muris]
MKILSYNINKCTQKKIDYVLSMDADIMVLPECARYDQIKLPKGVSMEWIGNNSVLWKGLGVIWRNQHEVVIAPWYNNEHKYILPLIVDRSFLLFATWPTIIPTRKNTYPQILLSALKEYEKYIVTYPTLICGDFNCFIGQSGVSKKTGTFEQCIEFLQEKRLFSLYHERNGEEFGKESKATYYHLFKEDKPFFIDFAFTNIQTFAYELGRWNKEMSDHCPQMIVL